jgi:glycosyltransferase involved in cell wall biosynthesis
MYRPTRRSCRNRSINALPHCRYVFKEVNEGRAAIRNFLAQQAQGEWLLLLDADLTMIDDHFLEKYIEAMKQADVVCGGYKVMEAPKATCGMLTRKPQPANRDCRAAMPIHTTTSRCPTV